MTVLTLNLVRMSRIASDEKVNGTGCHISVMNSVFKFQSKESWNCAIFCKDRQI